jgi:hypothetical protein
VDDKSDGEDDDDDDDDDLFVPMLEYVEQDRGRDSGGNRGTPKTKCCSRQKMIEAACTLMAPSSNVSALKA